MAARIGSYVRRHHVGLMALFVALSGTAWAATEIGPKDIEKNAVRSKHLQNDGVKGSDVSEATLGKVPLAAQADSAASAGTASSAQTATSAERAGTAGSADNAELLDGLDSSAFLGATAGAGGDLTGNYPNPKLNPGEGWHEVGAPGEPDFHDFCDWSNLGGVYATVGFYRDPLGIVHLKGVGQAGMWGDCQLFSLPGGYVPGQNEVFAVTTDVGGATGGIADHGQVRVDAAGAVRPESPVQTTGTGNLSLSGISFRCGPSGVAGCP